METIVRYWENGECLLIDFCKKDVRIVISSDVNTTEADRLQELKIVDSKETQILHIRQKSKKGDIGSYYRFFGSLVMEAVIDRYSSPLTITIKTDGNEDKME